MVIVFCLSFLLVVANTSGTVVLEMVHSAEHLLSALGADSRSKATFSFGDKERTNWHFIPRDRKGIPLGEMTPAQRKLAHALLATALSNRGLQLAGQIMYLEKILYELENQSARRNPDAYFFSIFGRPSASAAWGWRFEGHHLSLNFTVKKGEVISATPAFFGSNPAIVRDGAHSGLQVLKAEEELGRKLVRLFSQGQKITAVISAEAPSDIVTGATLQAEPGAPAGLAFSQMSDSQKTLLKDLINLYARRLRPELAQETLQGGEGINWERLHFAWAGGLEPRDPHYYRIQGPSFVVEYDNTQNNANHIHTVWRDLKNDFGRQLLREHYHEAH